MNNQKFTIIIVEVKNLMNSWHLINLTLILKVSTLSKMLSSPSNNIEKKLLDKIEGTAFFCQSLENTKKELKKKHIFMPLKIKQ